MKVTVDINLTYDGDDGHPTEIQEVLQVINTILQSEAPELQIRVSSKTKNHKIPCLDCGKIHGQCDPCN